MPVFDQSSGKACRFASVEDSDSIIYLMDDSSVGAVADIWFLWEESSTSFTSPTVGKLSVMIPRSMQASLLINNLYISELFVT